MSELVHPFELGKLAGLLRPSLGYLLANALYIIPVFLFFAPIFFASELLDTNIFAQLFTGSIIILLMIYGFFVTIFVQPAILVLGVRHGFMVALNPNNVFRFIRQNAADLMYLLLNEIVAAVLLGIVGILVVISVYICIGIVLLPIYLAILSAYEFIIMPLVYAQAWGEKEVNTK